MTESIAESSAEAVLNAAKTERIRVLHVDDDLTFLSIAKQCLELPGEIDVDAVSSVGEASEKLKKTDYDAIVCDYQMPGKDGLEFLEMLRRNGNTIPFIMFTGKGREEIAVKAWSLGADHYVNKTGDPETVYCELAHNIRQAVEKRKAVEMRKKAEETTKKSNEEWKTTFDAISSFVFILDTEFRLIKVNKALCDALKKEPRDLVSKRCYEVLHGMDKPWPNCPHKKTLSTGQTAIEEVNDSRLGCSLLISNSPIHDKNGKLVGAVHIAQDITVRKQMEKQLRESEEKYRNLFENSQDAIAIVNFQGNVLFANKAAERLTGYTLKDGKGLNIRAITPKRLWPKSIAMLLKARMGKPIPYFAYELKRKDGTIVSVETGGQAIFEDGKPAVIQIITREITDRRKTELSLKESEEKYKVLFENAMDAIVTLDLKGNITAVNNSILRFGIKKEDLVGKNILDFVSEDYRPAVMKDFSKVVQGEPVKNETELVVSARKFLVEYHAGAIVRENNVAGVQINIRDITERKNAEKLIQESQQKFEQLFMSNPEAAVYVDQNERVLNINPRFTELFGYSFDEVKEKPLDDFVVPEDRKKEAIMLAQKGREGCVYFETVRKNKEGSLVPVTMSSSSIVLQGQHVGDIVLYRDITERKKAEERLKEMNMKLGVSNEKLQVVGGLTRHDVRNKLSAVTGNIYLLRRRLAEDPEALKQMNDIEAAVRLVERIFEFARVYEKLGVEQLASMDVGKAFDGAVSLFSGLKGVKIVNECRGLTVLADSLLSQLFYNLIDNSLKYGEKTQQIKIYYKTSSADQLEIVYEDDGVGIPDSMRSNLFKEGFTSGKGTGYGLFMIKRICEVYGWAIAETGVPGNGAQFTLNIPKAKLHERQNDKPSSWDTVSPEAWKATTALTALKS